MPLTRSQTARYTRIPLAGGGQETLLSEVGAQYLLPLFSRATPALCAWFAGSSGGRKEQPWEDKENFVARSSEEEELVHLATVTRCTWTMRQGPFAASLAIEKCVKGG